MKVTKIDHVAILVEDLEKAGKFFADLLGTEFPESEESEELDIKNLMSPIRIELVTPLTQDGVLSRTLAKRGEGITLLSLSVPNLKEAVAEMKAKGIRQIGEVEGRAVLFHPKDLHGVTIELVEDKPNTQG
jgi:methylmalonyl-CoA epimerase